MEERIEKKAPIVIEREIGVESQLDLLQEVHERLVGLGESEGRKWLEIEGIDLLGEVFGGKAVKKALEIVSNKPTTEIEGEKVVKEVKSRDHGVRGKSLDELRERADEADREVDEADREVDEEIGDDELNEGKIPTPADEMATEADLEKWMSEKRKDEEEPSVEPEVEEGNESGALILTESVVPQGEYRPMTDETLKEIRARCEISVDSRYEPKTNSEVEIENAVVEIEDEGPEEVVKEPSREEVLEKYETMAVEGVAKEEATAQDVSEHKKDEDGEAEKIAFQKKFPSVVKYMEKSIESGEYKSSPEVVAMLEAFLRGNGVVGDDLKGDIYGMAIRIYKEQTGQESGSREERRRSEPEVVDLAEIPLEVNAEENDEGGMDDVVKEWLGSGAGGGLSRILKLVERNPKMGRMALEKWYLENMTADDVPLDVVAHVGEIIEAFDSGDVVAEEGGAADMFNVEKLPDDREQLIVLFRERMLGALNMATGKVKAELMAQQIGLVVPEASKKFSPEFPAEHAGLQEKLLAELMARVNLQNSFFSRLGIANDLDSRLAQMKGGGWSNLDHGDYVFFAELGTLNGESRKLLTAMEAAIKIYVDCGEERRGDIVDDLGRERFTKNRNTADGDVTNSNFFSIPTPSVGLISDIRARVRKEIGSGALADDAENLAWQFIQASDVGDLFSRNGNYLHHLNELTEYSGFREFKARFRQKQIGFMRLLSTAGIRPDNKAITGVFDASVPRLARSSWEYVRLERGDVTVNGLDLAREGRFFTGMRWGLLSNSPQVLADEGIATGDSVADFLKKLKEATPREMMSPDFFSGINGRLFSLFGKGVLSINEILAAKTEIALDIFWEISVKNPLNISVRDERGMEKWVPAEILENMYRAIMGSVDPSAGAYFDRITLKGRARFEKFETEYRSILKETKKRQMIKQIQSGALDAVENIIQGL